MSEGVPSYDLRTTAGEVLVGRSPLPVVKEPLGTTHKILYEFQVFFLRVLPDGHHLPDGHQEVLGSIVVRASSPGEARWHVEQAASAGAHFVVTSIGTGRALVDWAKPFWSRDEVEAAACISATSLSEAIAAGKIRKCGNVFSAEAVRAWREKG